jgi:hypothetical protein
MPALGSDRINQGTPADGADEVLVDNPDVYQSPQVHRVRNIEVGRSVWSHLTPR